MTRAICIMSEKRALSLFIWHGSLNPSDSYVPFIVSYPSGNKEEIDMMLKSDDVCKSDKSGCVGNWNLPVIVKGIINEQYQ